MATSLRSITRSCRAVTRLTPNTAPMTMAFGPVACTIVKPLATIAVPPSLSSSISSLSSSSSSSSIWSSQRRLMSSKTQSQATPVQAQTHASQSEVRSKPSAAATPSRVTGSNSVVITAAGPDRVGIVSELTQLLAEGNIEESRMTMLGNDFALILLVTLPSHISAEKIQSILQKAFPEFIVSARQTNTIPVLKDPTRILRIDLEGPDQPGIMAGLTQVFTDNNVSIRDLDTDTSSAPFAGYRIFSLKAWVAIPKSMTKEDLEEKLHIFETSNSVDLTVEDPIASTIESDSEEDDGHTRVEGKKRKNHWK